MTSKKEAGGQGATVMLSIIYSAAVLLVTIVIGFVGTLVTELCCFFKILFI